MTTSVWDRWLVDEIEDATPAGLVAWYLGCNGVAVRDADGTIIYVDPYLGGGDPPRTTRMIPVPFEPTAPSRATAILVTHEHTDHLHGPTQVPMLANTGATLYAPHRSIDLINERGWVDRFDIDGDQLAAVEPGDTLDLGATAVSVHGCIDPDSDQPVTYRIEGASGSMFHAADGRPGEVMEEIGRTAEIDLAFVAYGSAGVIPDKRTGAPRRTTWYNDTNDVILLANQLGADRLVPTHWDMWKGLTADPTALITHRRGFDSPGEVTVLEVGDRVGIPANN